MKRIINYKNKLGLKGNVLFSKRKKDLVLENDINFLIKKRNEVYKEFKNNSSLVNRKLLNEIQLKINDLIEYNKPINICSYSNVTTTVGRKSIANRLAGGSNDCDITYGAVGDTSVSPSIADTVLSNEIYRTTVAVISYSSAQVRARLYISSGNGNPAGGTLYEFGWFGDGATGVADSGVLFNHVSISENKTSSYSLTVDGYIDIDNLTGITSVDYIKLELTGGTGGVSQYDAVYVTDSGTVLCANAGSRTSARIRGIAMEDIAEGSLGDVQINGEITNASWNFGTIGGEVYLATTDGELTETPPSGSGEYLVRVGWVKSPTTLVIDIADEFIAR